MIGPWFEKNAEKLGTMDLLDRLKEKEVTLFLSTGGSVQGVLRPLPEGSGLKGYSDAFLNTIFLLEKGSLSKLIAIEKRFVIGVSASMED